MTKLPPFAFHRFLLNLSIPVMLAPLLMAQHHGPADQRALLEDPRLASGQIAPILYGLGSHHHPITTKVPRAQLFFDQGLKLLYGFNHPEAIRAFKEAVRLDPECAMAYWGWALALGPNLNLPMQAQAVPQAWEAIQMALARIDKVSEKEQDYVQALARRYAENPPEDRSALDQAYAEAMATLHRKYADDLDAATLYADSLMNLSPWNYWTRDGAPRPKTPEILATLESVMERDTRHEGAHHYYIHAVEAFHPGKGEAAADRLRHLAPGAGHLLHMPSHIYMQIGRYADAFEDNTLAAQADEGYIAQCRAQGIYPLAYYPHNLHFLVWSGMLLGRSEAALAAARKVASQVPPDYREDDWSLYQTFQSMPLYAMVRFGKWDEILSLPPPPPDRYLYSGISNYARGLAQLHKGNPGQASQELNSLQRVVQQPKTSEIPVGFSTAQSVLSIAREILQGEILAREGRFEEAISHLESAVRLQDGLTYTEPPDWYYPARHTLGAILLDAGRAGEAETVYWQDLRQYPENGFSLIGVLQSLRAQGKDAEAGDIESRLKTAWAYADVELSSSRF